LLLEPVVVKERVPEVEVPKEPVKAPLHQIQVGTGLFNAEEKGEHSNKKKKLTMANVNFAEYGRGNFASLNEEP